MIDPWSGSQFRLQCPICRSEVRIEENSGLCQQNGHRFSRAEGIWRFLPLAREVHYRKFMNEYRTVRRKENWGGSSPEYYRALPRVKANDPQRGTWRVRERNFRQLLAQIGEPARLRVLDAGAGNGWLSNQLSRRGHAVAALDLSDDIQDGLGARLNYDAAFECFQAEFDRLPFSSSQFDLVVFNAALHYSVGLEGTICEAKRVLAQRGRIFALDSPFYSKEADGTAMVNARESEFAVKFGFKRELANSGFLTRERLQYAAVAAGLKSQILMNDEGWDKRLRRAWTQRRTGREPAWFPLVIFGT